MIKELDNIGEIPWQAIDRKYMFAVIGKDRKIYLAEYEPTYNDSESDWDDIEYLTPLNIFNNKIKASESLTKRPECNSDEWNNHEWVRTYFIDDNGHETMVRNEFCCKCGKSVNDKQKYNNKGSIYDRMDDLNNELGEAVSTMRSCFDDMKLIHKNFKEMERIHIEIDNITNL